MQSPKYEYTRDEQKKIKNFLRHLQQEADNGRVKIVYRGDKLKTLFRKANVYFDAIDPDYNAVLNSLFILGEKGKHFYKVNNSHSTGRKFALDDVGNACFSHIFDHLAKTIKSKEEHQREFFRKNALFRDYFVDKINKPLFLKAIIRIDPRRLLVIKTYYLTVLHQLSAVNYRNKSLLVSTSEDRNMALSFAGHLRKEPGFLIHAWTTAPASLKQYFKGTGLPMYREAPFKKQKEISFFAGILPHYIIGLELVGKGITFYNPAITSNNITPLTFTHGLDIDQSNFEHFFKQSVYSSVYATDGHDHVELLP